MINNCKTIEGIALNCLFEMKLFERIDSVYTCVGTVLDDGSGNENVSAVYGTHETGKRHEDVYGIALRQQNLEFVPTNIEQFFPNIVAIDLYNNSITSISNRHLAPFPNLQYLTLLRNKITTIDGDLFDGINVMKHISFTSNNIRNVGHDLNLPTDGAIFFTETQCISQTATSPDAVASLKLNLLRNCPPTISQIERSLEQRQNLLTSIDRQVQSVTKNVNEITNRLESLRHDHTYLWDVVYGLLNRVAYLESIIGDRVDDKFAGPYVIDQFGNNEMTNRP